MPTAFITGVSGQDGSYLAEFLLGKGYRVIGLTRDARSALEGPHAHALSGVDLVQGSLDSHPTLFQDVVRDERPDEVYHLAGPSRVASSWDNPAETEFDIVMPLGLIVQAAIEDLPSPRVFFAGTCEVFATEDHAQDESAPRAPSSPYGQAKLHAMQLVEEARAEFGLYAVTGILFNHESPRRGPGFVTKKIARAAARIARGEERKLVLGKLDVRRDWGFAGDYVRAMWLMMFQEEPEDLVIGTGEAHSVADFCDAAFRHVGLDWQQYVTVNSDLVRRADPPLRLANPARARSKLGWTPEVNFQRLVALMVDAEMSAGLGGSK
ncbi:MAG TPA: GDP-mannose 4,6-dehydratase [Gemmatimonadaceae bacterium]